MNNFYYGPALKFRKNQLKYEKNIYEMYFFYKLFITSTLDFGPKIDNHPDLINPAGLMGI